MNKRLIICVVLIIIFIITFFITVRIVPDIKLSELNRYSLKEKEDIAKEFEYKENKYVLTTYYDDKYTYSFHNILYKKKNNYYFLEKIEQCDISEYWINNELYIHCIGKKGDILKYTIDKTKVKKETIKLNYENTPNISQIHITIDKVDDGYIYLKSAVKNDDSIEEGKHVKCLIETGECLYE